MRDLPRLTWLNAKQRPTRLGDRKNQSGHKPEHILANADNEAFEKAAWEKFTSDDNLVSE